VFVRYGIKQHKEVEEVRVKHFLMLMGSRRRLAGAHTGADLVGRWLCVTLENWSDDGRRDAR